MFYKRRRQIFWRLIQGHIRLHARQLPTHRAVAESFRRAAAATAECLQKAKALVARISLLREAKQVL